MIISVIYKDGNQAESRGMKLKKQLIHCSRVYVQESKTHWGFMAYDHDDKKITDHKFGIDEGVEAYITEHGKTVDVLPRR